MYVRIRPLGFCLAGILFLNVGIPAPVPVAVESSNDSAYPLPVSLESRTVPRAARDRQIVELADLPVAWQRLALCESSGRLDAEAGDSGQYQGLFQIEFPRTWQAHGGVTSPATAASVAEQYRVALDIYADRGYRPWPSCGKFLLHAYGR